MLITESVLLFIRCTWVTPLYPLTVEYEQLSRYNQSVPMLQYSCLWRSCSPEPCLVVAGLLVCPSRPALNALPVLSPFMRGVCGHSVAFGCVVKRLEICKYPLQLSVLSSFIRLIFLPRLDASNISGICTKTCCRYVVSALAKSVDVALALGPMVSESHTVQLQHIISSSLRWYEFVFVPKTECYSVARSPSDHVAAGVVGFLAMNAKSKLHGNIVDGSSLLVLA